MMPRSSSGLTEWEYALSRPKAEAEQHVVRAGKKALLFGHIIETFPHPNLSSGSALDELGWEASDIEVVDLGRSFDATEILAQTGGYREFDPPNGTKFGISEILSINSRGVRILAKRTNYFTLMSIKSELERDPELRYKFGCIDVSANRIPHSISLHYIVRFANGDILVRKRHPKAAYHPNSWSFSGEEQIDESDVQSEQPMESLFHRAFCEEVLALRDRNPATLGERWQIAEPIVDYSRMWSIFVEEPIFNFAIAGLYQLNVDRRQFIDLHSSLLARGMGSPDSLTRFFTISQAQILPLLTDDQVFANALLSKDGPAQTVITADKLHPSSRYRLFRLARAINRKPLESDTRL